MDWRQFVMNLESIDPDHIEAVLMENGAQSVTLTDAGDNPVLWANTRITALFDAHADFDALRVSLLAALQLDELPPNHIEDLADRAWEREWLKDFGPMQFGTKLWVVPGESDVPPADSVVVKLDPPHRNPPRRIKLRVRHPESKPIRSVWMNGKPHSAFDVEREAIYLEGWTEPVEVRVRY